MNRDALINRLEQHAADPASVSVPSADECREIVRLLRGGHAQGATDSLADRQPDLADGSRYTNIDIASRMWQSFNATGDRWYKYAAQRLSGSPAEGWATKEQIAEIIDPHAIGTVKLHGRQNASERAVRGYDQAMSAAERILALRSPAEMVAQCPDCPSPYLNGACGGNECCQGGPYTEGASVVRHELEAGGFYKTRGDKHNLPHIVGPLDHDPDDRDAPWKARVHDQVWKWGYDGLANAEGSPHNRDIVERVYPPSSRSQPDTKTEGGKP